MIDAATERGAIVVAAAGNDNWDAEYFNPAACDNVVTVMATSKEASRSSYSNYGEAITVAAPGGDRSALMISLGPDNTYNYKAGTSMATPIVSGVIALMKSVYPQLTASEAVKIMARTSKPFECGRPAEECGPGIIDAHAAVMEAKAMSEASTHMVPMSGAPKVPQWLGQAAAVTGGVAGIIALQKLMEGMGNGQI